MKKSITYITITILILSIIGITISKNIHAMNNIKTIKVAPLMDATLGNHYPDKKYGDSTIITAGFYHSDGTTYISRTLLLFPTLNKKYEILNVKLVLYAYGHYNIESPSLNIYVLKMGNSWKENEVTWNQRSNSQPWNNPGGDYILDGHNFSGSYGYFVVKQSDGPQTKYEVDITELYKYWQANPTKNYGLMLSGVSSTYGLTRYYSKDSNSAYKPYILIKYREPKIALSLGETQVQLKQGESRSFNLNIDSQVIDTSSGIKIKVVQDFPSDSGLAVSFNPEQSNHATFSSIITISASSTTPVGTYQLKIRAEGKASTDGSTIVSVTKTITVQVTAGGGFNLQFSPTHIDVVAGDAGESDLLVVPIGSFSFPVSLSVKNAPSGFNVQIMNSQVMPRSSTRVRVNVDSSVAPGNYQVVLQGESQGIQSETTLSITVSKIPFDFSVNVNKNQISLRTGESANIQISTNHLSGDPEDLELSLEGLPSDATATFGSQTISVGSSTTLTINAGNTTGSFLLVLKAKSKDSSVTKTANIELKIFEEPFKFSLSVEPKTVEVNQGESVTLAIKLEKTSGKSEPVSLELQGLPGDASYSFNPPLVTPPATSILTINAGSSKGTFTVVVKGTTSKGEMAVDTFTVIVKEQKCIVATSTYGSEVAPEVSFLRSFRDNIVLKTYPGTMFFRAFNAFYYSWSPAVAEYMHENPWLKPVMKILLYPLIGSLALTARVSQPVIDYNPTLGVYFAGTVASLLLGLFYILPMILVGKLLSRRRRIRVNVNKTLYVLCITCFVFLALSVVFLSVNFDLGVSLTSMSYVTALILMSGVFYYVCLRWAYGKTMDYYHSRHD